MTIAHQKDVPAFLLWVDIETTGLDPVEDLILEMAVILTRFFYPYDHVCRASFLVKCPPKAVEEALQANSFVRDMHMRTGLLSDLKNHTEQARSLSEIEEQLLDLSKDWQPAPAEDPEVIKLKRQRDEALSALQMHEAAVGLGEGVLEQVRRCYDGCEKAYREECALATDRRVVLAGSSVHFDKGFLQLAMPRFMRRVSHRIFDVSVASLLCRSLGMPRLPKPDDKSSHRAGYDVARSIEQMKMCERWIKSLDALKGV